MNELQSLLSRAADEAGSFPAPPVAALRRRAHRQARLRTAAAMLTVAVLVAALAVGLSLRGPHSAPTAQGFDASRLPGPTGPVVTAHELAGYRWADLPHAPIAGRYDTASAWTGSAMLVWGGDDGAHHYFDDGASYDPSSRSWSRLPAAPLTARAESASAWVSGNLIIWGGDGAAGRRADGARYDPATARWTMLPPAPLSADGPAQGFAVGSTFVVINMGGGAAASTFQGAAYDVDTNSWQRLPDLVRPTGHDLQFAVGLGVGATLFLWAYWSQTVATGPGSSRTSSGADSYALQDGAWFAVPLQPRLGMSSITPLWTGHSVLLANENIYCGLCNPPYLPPHPGELIDPRTGARTVIPAQHLLDPQYEASVWTGGALLLIAPAGTFTGPDPTHPDRSGAWDPRTKSWTPLPAIPFDPNGFPVTVWTGSRLLVWTGLTATPSGTGGVEFAPSP